MRTNRPIPLFIFVSTLLSLLFGGLSAQAAPPPQASPSPRPAASEGTFVRTLSRAPDAASDWHPLKDRFARFDVAVPADWTEGLYPADQPGMFYALVACESQPRDGFSTNLVVSQTQAPERFVMKADMVAPIAKKMTEEMKSYGYTVKDKAFTRLGGLPCVIVGGTLEVDGRRLRNLQLRVVHRGMNYLFTFTALDARYTQYEGLFARVVKSIVFEPEMLPPSPSPSPASSAIPRP